MTPSPSITSTSGTSNNKSWPDPELFSDDKCDRRMPVREVIESYDFGQFIDLVAVKDDLTYNLLINKIHGPALVNHLLNKLRNGVKITEKTSAQIMGGIPILDLVKGNAGNLVKKGSILTEVKLNNPDKVLANRTVEVDGKTAEIDINKENIRALLDEEPIITVSKIQGQEKFIYIVPKKVKSEDFATSPCLNRHVVNDLPSFIHEPLVPGSNGKPYRVDLSVDMINELRIKGKTTIHDGKIVLEIVLNST